MNPEGNSKFSCTGLRIGNPTPEIIALKDLMENIHELANKMGYIFVKKNSQRIFGPPLNYDGPDPESSNEIFIGGIPHDVNECDLIPVFSRMGKLYDFRMIERFDGQHQGYAFAKFIDEDDAVQAWYTLQEHEISPGNRISVAPNCRVNILYIGKIPEKFDPYQTLQTITNNLCGVKRTLISEPDETGRTAVVHFREHKDAILALRHLRDVGTKVWCSRRGVSVNWLNSTPITKKFCLYAEHDPNGNISIHYLNKN